MILWFGSMAALADTPVALTALPAPITATLVHQWPTAKAASAAKDGSEFEVEMTDGARKFTAVLKADGSWVETEEKVDVATLPAAVKTAAARLGTVTRAELRTMANGHVDYELGIHPAHGKDSELHVDATGAVAPAAKEEDEEDEDEGKEDDEK